MKKVMKAIAAVMLTVAVVCAAGCKKTDDPNNGGNNGNNNGGNGGGGLNEHAYVDLGLPSGTLWATCNVGAETPDGYGDYFAWGETTPKTTYNWSTYKYCKVNSDGRPSKLTKYNTSISYGTVDNLTLLQMRDDAATANWGSGWRTPTMEQWEELVNNTTSTWTTQNGVNGRLFTANNGASLFLPAAGGRWDSELVDAGYVGDYWSSSLYTDDPGSPKDAWDFYFDSGYYGVGDLYRYGGQSVRAVREN